MARRPIVRAFWSCRARGRARVNSTNGAFIFRWKIDSAAPLDSVLIDRRSIRSLLSRIIKSGSSAQTDEIWTSYDLGRAARRCLIESFFRKMLLPVRARILPWSMSPLLSFFVFSDTVFRKPCNKLLIAFRWLDETVCVIDARFGEFLYHAKVFFLISS